MPERLENLMHESTEGLQVRWDAPETIRRRGDRRRLRWRGGLVVVAVAALGLAGRVVLAPGAAPTIPGPNPSSSGCAADLTLPQSERDVKLRVFHSAAEVAAHIADDFLVRGFEVEEAAATTESTGDYVAVIRFGPAEVGDAWLVRAYVVGDLISMDFDRTKTGTVDVLLGPRFQQLNTKTAMRQRIAVLGRPEAPEGC